MLYLLDNNRKIKTNHLLVI